MKQFFLIGVIFFSFFIFTGGCAQNPVEQVAQPSLAKKEIKKPEQDLIKFSENPNVGTFSDRKYRRSTRKTLEDESEVHSRAGSLWNNEGQGAYLFTQNKTRREGDILSVKLEGAAKSQVETKVQVIKKLLARIEMIRAANTPPLVDGANPTDGENSGRGVASDQDPSKAKTPEGGQAQAATPTTVASKKPVLTAIEKEPEEEIPFSMENVSTRVVERLSDGNYRVKGTQPFMIGKREYKVIVTGMVRPEDFSDEGVSSNKLLDPQWDVVSLRKVMQ